MCQIAETAEFRKTIETNKELGHLYPRITEVVYPVLRREPHFGPNVKRLKGGSVTPTRFQSPTCRLHLVTGK